MLRWFRGTKWGPLAASLLLIGQPAFAQKAGLTPQEEAALDNAADMLEDDAEPSPPVPTPPRPQPEPRPAIWLLQDADTKIYLFGTVHILPPGFRWRSAAVNDMIREADELVVEVSERDMMDNAGSLMSAMLLGKEAPLAWRVSPDRREALARMLDEFALPAALTESMQTWAASIVIMAAGSVRGMGGPGDLPASLDDMPGVEEGLEAEFRARNRPISGVETMAESIGFFSNMSFVQQRELLEAMIDDYGREGANREDLNLLDAWVRGNPDGVVIDADDMPAMLYDALLPRRNRAWTDWLIARLERPGTVLFAVGAGHLAGPDSVQTMLSGRGFTVARLP